MKAETLFGFRFWRSRCFPRRVVGLVAPFALRAERPACR